MKIRNVLVIPFLLLVLTAVSCGNSKSRNDRTETVDKEVIKAPEFDADSAYQYIQVQADFGPRVPNTQAHKECGEYLAGQLEKFGAKVYNQYADLIAYDGTILKSRNIIGAYKPESKKRILLCAHWDSRPYADNDPDPKNHHTPILGVNDGASGVGVLLEIARQIQKEQPALGIDIVFLIRRIMEFLNFMTADTNRTLGVLDHNTGHVPHMFRTIMHAMESCWIW